MKEKVYINGQKSRPDVYLRVIRYKRDTMQDLTVTGRQLYICM